MMSLVGGVVIQLLVKEIKCPKYHDTLDQSVCVYVLVLTLRIYYMLYMYCSTSCVFVSSQLYNRFSMKGFFVVLVFSVISSYPVEAPALHLHILC